MTETKTYQIVLRATQKEYKTKSGKPILVYKNFRHVIGIGRQEFYLIDFCGEIFERQTKKAVIHFLFTN